jgi:hypothetical protein
VRSNYERVYIGGSCKKMSEKFLAGNGVSLNRSRVIEDGRVALLPQVVVQLTEPVLKSKGGFT